ncbi:MAG TPA: hypothetical protein ENL22_08625 [candidate division Zixibacteria bacterium]|nr:hypothetical protein [candidate division Zixibacteria bacterium]
MRKDLNEVQQVYGGKSKKSLWAAAAIIIILAGGAYFTRDQWLPAAQLAIESTEVNETISDIKEAVPTEKTSKDTTISDEIVAADDKQEKTEEPKEPAVKQEQTPDTNSSRVTVAASVEPKTESKPEPPKPPPLPTLIIGVVPDYNVAILVDGVEKSPNKKFDIIKGNHEITIIHPDFPILSDQVQTNVDRSIRYNLRDEFYLRDTITFRIGASPSELGDAILEVLFNGHGNKYSADNLPILDLQKLSGKWQIGFNILNARGRRYPGAKVDSAVSFPYGGGPREFIRKGLSTIDFGAAKWHNVESIDILVYWSQD